MPGGESEARAQRIVQLAADWSYQVLVRADGTVCEEWTAGDYEGLTGYAYGELAPRDWAKLVHPEDRSKVRPLAIAALDDRPERIDVRIVRKDGAIRWVTRSRQVWRDSESGDFHIIGAVQDITDRVAATEERACLEGYLREMQKIEALGALAGGVAHDFNNLLYVVIGNAQLALRKLPRDTAARTNVEEILSVARRGAEITAKILAFNRPDLAEERSCDLDEVTREAIGLLRATIPSSVAIQLDSRVSATVPMGATDLHQVLINLFTNASEAMPGGGSIHVSIEPAPLGEEGPAVFGVAPGRYVWVVVSDSGHGMTPEVRERIFEPRFTTKPPSRNSGMGLAVLQGIVRRYGGFIECTSIVGRGSTFRVLLPTVERRAASETMAPAAELQGRILFVDDEPDVVRMAREMLESLGYEVEGRTSSRQALEAFRAAPSRYDLVLTDQTMPELTGDALVREIRRLRPEVPVILCSGYHERIAPETAARLSIQACLQKPIDIDTLSRVVQGALAAAPAG